MLHHQLLNNNNINNNNNNNNYSGATLACFHARLLKKMQLVLNGAARLVFGHASMNPLLHSYVTCKSFVFQNVSRFSSQY